MAMVVKNNMSAVNTLNTLNKNQSLLGKSLQKVSSGMKINSAQDDASGYAISERMRVMIRSLDQANQNTQNGSSLMKVAEGAVSNTVEILKTLKEKAINAATDTNTDEDRAIIQKEIDQLVDQIDDNALVTFNGKYLLDGSKSTAGDATYNTWTNQSLSEDTLASTKLVDLKARDGEALTIETSDKVTVSYVQNGKTYTTTQIIGKMDNATLAGIFQLAENIDDSSDIFAKATHDAIATLGGVEVTSPTAKTIEDAFNYLVKALSVDTSTYQGLATIATADSNKYPFLAVDYETLGDEAAQFTTTTTASSSAGNELAQATAGQNEINLTYNGEIFQTVADALTAYNNANTLANNLAAAFGETLENADNGQAWDETNIYAAKDLAVNAGADALNAYNQYVAALEVKNERKTALNAAVVNYNENLAQLDVLAKLKDLEDAKTAYTDAVGVFINAAKSAIGNSANTATFLLEAGVAGNTTNLSYDYGTSDDDDESAIISALQTKLNALLTDVSLDTKNVDGTANTNNPLAARVKKVFDVFKYDSKKIYDSSALDISTDDYSGLSALQSAAEAICDKDGNGAAKDYDDVAAIAGKSDNVVNTNLAYTDIIAEYSGPAILTGANVGLDHAGKIVTTLDGKAGLTFMAANSGTDGQISGFTVSISDSDGNVRKSVNTVLNAWSTSVYGKNASEKDNSLAFQIGASANQTITVDMADMRAEALGLKGKDGKVVDVSNKENANAAISVFENALQKALDVQTTIGAIEARLEYTASNLTTSTENVQAAESTIRDADMAKEMTNYTKNNVLLQAAQSMLAQANQNSSAVLSLLQ